jgi:hypothetical protein
MIYVILVNMMKRGDRERETGRERGGERGREKERETGRENVNYVSGLVEKAEKENIE